MPTDSVSGEENWAINGQIGKLLFFITLNNQWSNIQGVRDFQNLDIQGVWDYHNEKKIQT